MRLSTTIRLGSALATGLLTGTAAEAQPTPTEQCETVADGRLVSGIVDVRECWPSNLGDEEQYYLNDLYTRWVVEDVSGNFGAMVRDYKRERRSPLERFFLGKTRNTTITVKIHMRDPDVDFTLPLLVVDYSGKRGEGQVFTTTLTRSDMGLADFRITPTTSANIETSARSSSELDVQATGMVLGTLRDALAIVSPGSSLLTSINREQIQKTSTAYDAALSRLLSSTVSETITSGRLLSEWHAGNKVLVSVTVPRSVRTLENQNDPDSQQVGTRRLTFKIGMTCPRLSAFDTLSVCEVMDGSVPVLVAPGYPSAPESDSAAGGWPGWDSNRYKVAVGKLRGRLSPQQVLSFRLAQNKTLRQFLTEQEWFLSLSKTIVTVRPSVNVAAAKEAEKRPPDTGADEQARPAPVLAEAPAAGNGPQQASQELQDSVKSANELCQAITEKLYSAGLSRLDSSIGLWAAITGMSDFSNARGVFQNAPACRSNMPVGPAKGRWRFEEAPVPDEEPAKARPTKRGMRRTR